MLLRSRHSESSHRPLSHHNHPLICCCLPNAGPLEEFGNYRLNSGTECSTFHIASYPHSCSQGSYCGGKVPRGKQVPAQCASSFQASACSALTAVSLARRVARPTVHGGAGHTLRGYGRWDPLGPFTVPICHTILKCGLWYTNLKISQGI